MLRLKTGRELQGKWSFNGHLQVGLGVDVLGNFIWISVELLWTP